MKTKTDIILECVCDYFQLTPTELFKTSRKRAFVRPRHIFYYLMTKYTGLTLSKIGETPRYYSRKIQDHATILHAKQRIESDLWADKYRKNNTTGNYIPDNENVLLAVGKIEEAINALLGGPNKLVPTVVKRFYDYLFDIPMLEYTEVTGGKEICFEKVLIE